MPLIIQDTAPDETIEPGSTGSSTGYECGTCGTELFYAGKGRKPKFCTPNNGGKQACYQANKPSTSTPGRTTSIDQLVNSIEGFYQTIGMGLSFYPPATMDGIVITTGARAVAESWKPVLQRDRKVREVWEKFFQVSGWGTVIMAHAALAYPIMQNHGILPKPAASPVEPVEPVEPLNQPWIPGNPFSANGGT